MLRMKLSLCVVAAVALAVGVATNDAQAQRSLRGEVKVDGSSTVYPITEAVAEEFSKLHKNVKITVGVSGTGGGFKRFSKGETDISDASRPIKAKELAICVENGVNFVEIPVAYDGLSIVVNKQNDFVKSMTVDDLKKIFLEGSALKSWKELNPSYPDMPIKIYAPGTDSGTFDYFKEVVAGKEGVIRSDMSVSEDDNELVRGVAQEKGGLGFFGYAYYKENMDTLRAVPIINPAGKPITPNMETIESGEYAPFSRPLFIYVSGKSAKKPAVKAFVEFYFEKGPELAEEVGYVRLPSKIQMIAKMKFARNKYGTHFLTAGGEKISGPLADIYK